MHDGFYYFYYVRQYFAGMNANGNARRAVALVKVDETSARMLFVVKDYGQGARATAAKAWGWKGAKAGLDPEVIRTTPAELRRLLRDYPPVEETKAALVAALKPYGGVRSAKGGAR